MSVIIKLRIQSSKGNDMKNILKTLILLAFAFSLPNQAAAQIKNVTRRTDAYDTITVTGFLNYPPVGYTQKPSRHPIT